MSVDSNWIQIGTRGDSTYYYDSRRDYWRNHQNRAATHGGYLVSLNDVNEYNDVVNILKSRGIRDTWIGLTDDPNNVSGASEGRYWDKNGKANWRWMDGSRVTYDKWNTREPNDSRGEDVAHFTGSNYKWNDHRYTHRTRAVIEIAGDRTPPSISISSTDGSSGTTSNDASISINFDLSEPSLNFTENDISLSGGLLSNFQKGTGSSYSGIFTPNTDGSTSISVGSGKFDDESGNSNTASNTFNWSFDTVISDPSLEITSSSNTGYKHDNITSDTTPTFVGTAEPNSSVDLFNGNIEIASNIAVNDQGDWIHTISPLGLGTHSISAQSTDIAGNLSSKIINNIKVESENKFILNPEYDSESQAATLKNDNSKQSHGLDDNNLFNIKDVVGETNSGWGSVRLPSRLRKFLYFDNSTLKYKDNRPDEQIETGLFRFFARSQDNLTKKAFNFFVNPKSSLNAREEAINNLNTWNWNNKSTSWRDAGQKTESEREIVNIFQKFNVDSSKENDYLDKFYNGSASIVSNADNNMVILDTSQKNDVLIVDSLINDVDRVIKTNDNGEEVTRYDQIKEVLKVEVDEVVETPIGELDFSVDTLANGSAIVQLQLEEGDQNINRIIKTNNQDESFLYNSTIITYDPSEHGDDFDAFVEGLQYSINYYDQPVGQDPNNPLTLDIKADKDSNIDQLLINEGVPFRNYSIIDGSAYLIDKDGDGDIEIVSAFLLDQGFFDTDDQVGLIRDPMIPVVSPIPGAPVVDGSIIVNNSTPVLSGTTDNSGNTINIYEQDGTTLIASTLVEGDLSWSVSVGEYESGMSLADGSHTLKVEAVDPITDLPSDQADLSITVDTISPVITGLGPAFSIDENSKTVGTFTADESIEWTLGGDDANKFNIDASGNLSFISAPDFENSTSLSLDNDYQVSVIGTDIAGNNSSDSLTVSVSDLDEIDPLITGIGAIVSVDENSKSVGTFTADESVDWTLSGDDANKFEIDGSGNLSFISAPDFGDPKSLSGNNNYEVNVIATDYSIYANNSLTSLTVTVADIEEDFTGFIDTALTYNYRIQRADVAGTPIDESLTDITGLLGYSLDGNETRFETDDLSGAATKYNIVIEAKVSGNSTSEKVVNLDTFDTIFSFNAGGYDLFNTASATVTFGDEINSASSYDFLVNDSIRATGATLDELNDGDVGIKTGQDFTELFTVSGVTINAAAAQALGESGITFSTNTNIYDTVMSVRTEDNAEIKSLEELRQSSTQSDDATDNVTIHEAYSEFKEQGTTLYTTRTIGTDVNTSLIRDGSVVNARSSLFNDGTFETQADKIIFDQIDTNSNFRIMSTTKDLSGAYVESSPQFLDSISIYTAGEGVSRANVIDANSIYQSSNDGNSNWIGEDGGNITINYKVKVDGKVGQTLGELDTAFFEISGDDVRTTKSTSGGGKISNNLITFQGDINYDGRVSLKDLAFLNAGALNEGEGFAADDVDANFDGTISTTDLAILDRDWGGNLHEAKSKGDLISSDDWTSIENKGGKTFDEVIDVVNFDNSVWENESDTHSSLSPIGIPDQLAGDIYSEEGDLYTGSSLFADDSKDFGAESAPIIGYDPT